MPKFPRIVVIFIAVLLTVLHSTLYAQIDTKEETPVEPPVTSSEFTKDSTKAHSSPIEDIISYPAADSTVYDLKGQRVQLYKAARIDYQDISLEADYISFDFREMEVLAYGIADSSGAVQGRPVFSQGSSTFRCDTIRYNFDSEKGLISGVITNDGESYVHAELAKKHDNGEIHNAGGKYTTCNLDNPHYHFRFNKMIVIPEDKIVTGPIFMKVRKVPLPLGLPFGFFPNTTKQKAGILIPSYGQNDDLGYFFVNGGYYIPISDHLDTKLTGDIYTRGSWGARNQTRYFNKYKYQGNIDLTYARQLTGDRELLNFSRTSSFFIRWNHVQDGKARPGTTFNANINAGTSNSFRNNYNSSLNDYISNTFASGVSYSKRWPTSQLTTSFRHSQNTSNRTVSFTLPQLGFNLNRFYLPLSFLRKNPAGPKKAFETIGITYNSSFENRLNTTEQQLRFDNTKALSAQMVNGVNHNISANTSMKMGYFSVNPNFRLTERWHFAKQDRFLADDVLVTDTLRGFYATRDYSMSASLNTKIFGMFAFRNSRVKAIRHVITPALGFTYAPEVDYRRTVINEDAQELIYNPFSVSSYAQGNSFERASLDFTMQNSLEMKIKTRSDTASAKEKKVKLVENYSLNTFYNMVADSLNLSDIRMSARTTLFKNTQLQYSGNFSPYQVDTLGRNINRFLWSDKGPILRGLSHNIALSTSLKGGAGNGKSDKQPETNFAKEDELQEVRNNPNAFADFSIPWNLTLSYTVSIAKQYKAQNLAPAIDTTLVSQHGLLFQGDLRLFKKWMLGFSSGYDLKNSEWTSTVLTLNWDLHCWAFTAQVIPFGDRKSYSLTLGINAAVLQDLKYTKRGVLGNGQSLLF